MPNFAANLTMLFNEVDFLDRFAEAKKAGFKAVEFLFPYDFDKDDIALRLEENGLKQALFNMPPGNWNAGDRGMAAIPERREEFRNNIAISLEYAEALKCKKLHVMAGVVLNEASRDEMETCYIENLSFAADLCAAKNIELLIEPLNKRDVPNYFLNSTDQAREIIKKVGRSNLALQLDIYHLQISEGDLERRINALADITGHYQIAGVPLRREPNMGEVNYSHIFKIIDDTGYTDWVGCEYHPRSNTIDGLSWMESI